MVLRFWLVMKRHRKRLLEDENYRSAAVVLCVRGTDPTLEECLAAILDLDYPDFRVRIVADDANDPACKIARGMIDSSSIDVQLMIVSQPLETCSLKCSSLIHAIEEVKDEVEFIALIDADTKPHSTWLSELVAPFTDDAVGATTGIRWYTPAENIGSMMRHIWNSAAIVQMEAYRIAWGGTLCFRSSVFGNGELLKKWSLAFCEDTMTASELTKQNLKLASVPTLVMSSDETTQVSTFVRWMSRQLLTSRLYHPAWFMVVAHCVATTLGPLIAVVFLVTALVSQDYLSSLWLAGILVTYEIIAIFLLIVIGSGVKAGAANRTLSNRKFRLGLIPLFLLGLVGTQLAYGWGMLSAFRRNFDWRGIDYVISGPWKIEMKEYIPYCEVEHSLDEDESL